MKIGKKIFNEGHTHIMGILNVTPDSFSDGGRYNRLDDAMFHIEEMIADGADLIDIGGESTRPGYEHISVEMEIERVAPVIERAVANFDIPLSIDTYKPLVATEAVKKGAVLINDIWGLRGEDFQECDPGMAQIVADNDVACCIMHNDVACSNIRNGVAGCDMHKGVVDCSMHNDVVSSNMHDDAFSRVVYGLAESIKLAEKAGIKEDRILLDPGIGFGKTYEDNLEVLRRLKNIKESFEYPMLLGTSRKSVIGLTLNLPSGERLEGTLATTAKAVEAGCLFVRVHDVKENARFIKMLEAIK